MRNLKIEKIAKVTGNPVLTDQISAEGEIKLVCPRYRSIAAEPPAAVAELPFI